MRVWVPVFVSMCLKMCLYVCLKMCECVSLNAPVGGGWPPSCNLSPASDYITKPCSSNTFYDFEYNHFYNIIHAEPPLTVTSYKVTLEKVQPTQIKVKALGTRANEDESSDLLSPSITTQLYYDFHILKQEVSQVIRASQATPTPLPIISPQPKLSTPQPYLSMYSVVSVSCLPHTVGSNGGLWIVRVTTKKFG